MHFRRHHGTSRLIIRHGKSHEFFLALQPVINNLNSLARDKTRLDIVRERDGTLPGVLFEKRLTYY